MNNAQFWSVVERLDKHPETVTDRELAQIRRSNRTGSNLLYSAVYEQWRRELLTPPMGKRYIDGPRSVNGYWRETKKRVSDYPENQISPRLF